MGVAGLWDLLRPAGQTRSLTHLSVIDGFEANPDGIRGFRIGIDASIWFFHAAYGKEGENPELRTLFFRCSRLMSMPFLPLFVFDGPKRPSIKRGKRVGGNAHWLTTGMKNIIEAFGFEWRTAPGEAEAELAYLNRIGVIDAVLSDDVDNFLFGATVVIRNPSNTLSGNRAHPVKNSEGRDDGNHAVIYRASDIRTHPDVQLTRGGVILIGLLSGGDYHQAGVMGCGKLIARGLARCGFGDSLVNAAESMSRDELPDFLAIWREDVKKELRTNSMGHIGSKKPSLASKIPEDFPDVEILLSYTNPITSETEGKGGRNSIKITWEREPDLGKVAGLCELYFEWGVKDVIIKRFRTVLWPSAVLRILRRAALEADEKRKKGIPSTPSKAGSKGVPAPGTPSKMITSYFSSMKINSPKVAHESDSESEDEDRLIVKIHSSRAHASTDGLLEFRLEIAPAQLVRLSEDGVKGIRPPIEADDIFDDDEGDDEEEDRPSKSKTKSRKPPPDPESHIRVWMPASMVRMVEPHLVAQFEEVQQKKADKKAGKGRAAPKKATGKKAAPPPEEEKESSPGPLPAKKAAPRKKKPTAANPADEELEYINLSPDEEPAKAKATTVKDFYAVTKGVPKMRKAPPPPKAMISIRDIPPRSKPVPQPRITPSMPSSRQATTSKPLMDALQSISAFTPRKSKLNRTLLTSDDDSDHDDVLPVFAKPTRNAPRPFPMPSAIELGISLEGEVDDPFSGPQPNHIPFSHPPPVSPSKIARKKPAQSSDSEGSNSHITKSPRKNLEDTSPRAKATPNNRSALRPASPTPARPLRLLCDDVIEISSDSDAPVPPSKPARAPLLLARAKAQIREKASTTSCKGPSLKGNVLTANGETISPKIRASVQGDIIDLT
ncbi:hypothetical protein BV22DRAFT_508362 [Leucogyrophana mollusca]|uniref:Uncharacterized protein n=1 Tax=Leucogyrophana mollusca TaxID=85980 RepID=A0ACB8BGQ2_9AGAM|nr:hypothetical protein BV22DRAFT_508362 [Leucogyrophana mollusca]